MTRTSPRLPLSCRLAGFMRLAARSCRSFAATSMTSWSQPRQWKRIIQPPRRKAGPAGSGAPGGSAPNLPRNWQEIGVGDLVVAQESLEDGWYEAIVVEADGDMLTLRWRDYPRQRQVVRHRLRLGLLYPSAQTDGRDREISESSAVQAKPDKTVATNPDANRQSLPKDWDDIDIGHLVVAKVCLWHPGAHSFLGTQSWANCDRNPCANGGKLYHGTRINKIWDDQDVAQFLQTAPPYLRLAMLLAINTGQRQGDLLLLPWSAYNGTEIKLRQEKPALMSRSRLPMR